MIILNNNDKNNIKTKEELIDELKKYKSVLSDSMYIYFKQLIDLDFSIVKNYISKDDRKILSNLNIYEDVMIYNIYNKVLNVFKDSKYDLKIRGYESGNDGLSVYANIDDKDKIIFDFIKKTYAFNKLSEPSINIYKISEVSEELRNKELERLKSKLDYLYNEKNPYHNEPNVYGGPSDYWNFEHNKMVKKYEELLKKLDERKLTDEDKKEIEITNYFHKKLFDDYGLNYNNFEETKDYLKDNSFLEKTLVKNMPKMKIVDHEKYI